MKKLSKKQMEVVKILQDNNSGIILLTGLEPHCFLRCDIQYKISTATLFALIALDIVEMIKEDYNSEEYYLNENFKNNVS